MKMIIPEYAKTALDTLIGAGYDAYLVGGCVRDSLLGKEPTDYDICTSALPAETESCFAGRTVRETGLKHGTVTVVIDKHALEITTFRGDGAYSDNRRPDSVEFKKCVDDDLSRRDFTINALAYNERRGLVDLFGGEEDISAKIIRCVGGANARFNEDGLRILRALRFASRLGFSIEKATADAIRGNKNLLLGIAVERVFAELRGILAGDGAEEILLDFSDVIFTILPELKPLSLIKQNNPHHIYDGWTHTVKAVAAAEKKDAARLAMLFHDSGKPKCASVDEKEIEHYYGHAEISAKIADETLRRLTCDNKLRERVTRVVRYHDYNYPKSERAARRMIAAVGRENIADVFAAMYADNAAKEPSHRDKSQAELAEAEALCKSLLAREDCFSVDDLAIDGEDIMALGIEQGKRVGEVLRYLLEEVIKGEVKNDREELLARAKRAVKR